MLNTLKAALVAVTALSASTAYAGGPVIEEGNDAQVSEQPASSVGILPVIGALVLICLLVCGGDDDEPAPVTPVTKG